jgi:RNA polymerase sigma-70 factor (ECF subfamily)
MEKALQGDQRSYDELLAELAIWLRRYFSRRMPYDAVEDTIQDVLLAVHFKRYTYMPSRPFGPWVAAIARFKWIDFIRSYDRTRATELCHDIAVSDHASAVASSIIVHDLLGRLKPAQAQAIRRVKLEGDTVEQTAFRLGQSEALVKVNVHRGIRKLAAMVT